MKTLISGSLLAAAISSGCIVERQYSDPSNDGELQMVEAPFDRGVETSLREAVNGRIVGDVGPVRGLDERATELTAYDDGYYGSVEMIVEPSRDDAAMTIVNINGGLDHPALRPGLSATFSADSYPTDENELYVTTIGCAGEKYAWDFDAPADDTQIVVEEGEVEGQMDVTVTSRFYERDPATGARLDSYTEATSTFSLVEPRE